ncbi:MAG TPA: DUF302 domain-containing protein [Chitinophagaceae bacterium]|nr:DUF302 domain-containing protein [Chitinophagaceae bacterium]
MNNAGIIVVEMTTGVKETMDKLERFIREQGATIYARINQQAEVASKGGHLFPLELLMFGNPAAGGPLMAAHPLIALDLPLKLMAWQDEDKKVWLAYNDGNYLEKRYGIPHAPDAVLHLDKLVKLALG